MRMGECILFWEQMKKMHSYEVQEDDDDDDAEDS